MALPHDMGRYIGRFTGWTVEEGDTGKNLLQFIASFSLPMHWNGAEWIDVTADDLSITGYFFLMKSDGSPNTRTIENLRAAMGWDGRSLATLNDSDWSSTEVQLTIEKEDYQGKARVKVKWINPRDSVPGANVTKADPQVIQSLDQKYGAILRAATPAAINGKPKTGAAPAQSDPKRQAWDYFKTQHPGLHADALAEAWKSELMEVFQGQDPKTLMPDSWVAFLKALKQPKVMAGCPPFSEEPQFNEDDIPF